MSRVWEHAFRADPTNGNKQKNAKTHVKHTLMLATPGKHIEKNVHGARVLAKRTFQKN